MLKRPGAVAVSGPPSPRTDATDDHSVAGDEVVGDTPSPINSSSDPAEDTIQGDQQSSVQSTGLPVAEEYSGLPLVVSADLISTPAKSKLIRIRNYGSRINSRQRPESVVTMAANGFIEERNADGST